MPIKNLPYRILEENSIKNNRNSWICARKQKVKMILKGTGRQAVLPVESWGLTGKWGGWRWCWSQKSHGKEWIRQKSSLDAKGREKFWWEGGGSMLKKKLLPVIILVFIIISWVPTVKRYFCTFSNTKNQQKIRFYL